MTNDDVRHLPTPEFKAALENELVLALRRQSRFAAPQRQIPYGALRTAATLLIGVLLGVGGGMASAQVKDNEQRTLLLLAVQEKRQIETFKLQLAASALTDMQKAVALGARTNQELVAAQLDVTVLQYRLKRLDVELEEVRTTAATARDELWAPKVGSHDFVKERLMLDAAAAQNRLSALEVKLANVERNFGAGVVTEATLGEARADMEQGRRELNMFAVKSDLRDRFVAKRITQAELAGLLLRHEARNNLERATTALGLAKMRTENARKRNAAGALGELELKKAEIDELELKIEVDQLQRRIAQLATKTKNE